MELLISIVLGAIAGWIAGMIMKSHGGILRNIILGIVGGFLGNFLFGLLKISIGGMFGGLIVAVVGACLCIWIGKLIFK